MGMGDASGAQAPTDMPPVDGQDDMGNLDMMGGESGSEMPPMDGQGDMDMMDDTPDSGDKDTDEISALIDQLSIEDKAAAKKYIESMVNKSSDNEDEEPEQDEESAGEPDPNMAPMMESIVITKGQHKRLMEAFEPSGAEEDDNLAPQPKKNRKGNKKSPFNNPNFNRL